RRIGIEPRNLFQQTLGARLLGGHRDHPALESEFLGEAAFVADVLARSRIVADQHSRERGSAMVALLEFARVTLELRAEAAADFAPVHNCRGHSMRVLTIFLYDISLGDYLPTILSK